MRGGVRVRSACDGPQAGRGTHHRLPCTQGNVTSRIPDPPAVGCAELPSARLSPRPCARYQRRAFRVPRRRTVAPHATPGSTVRTYPRPSPDTAIPVQSDASTPARGMPGATKPNHYHAPSLRGRSRGAGGAVQVCSASAAPPNPVRGAGAPSTSRSSR